MSDDLWEQLDQCEADAEEFCLRIARMEAAARDLITAWVGAAWSVICETSGDMCGDLYALEAEAKERAAAFGLVWSDSLLGGVADSVTECRSMEQYGWGG